jgi:hypothetical protein
VVYDRLQALGYTPEQVDAAIIRAEGYRLIETASRRKPVADRTMPSAMRATTIGVYHAKRLCRRFAYVDAIIVDTPVFSPEAREQIRDVHTIQERLERVEVFREYLEQQWVELAELDTVFDWRGVSADLGAHVVEIRRRVSRA